MKIDINKLINALSKLEPVFQSEAQFQFALALEIKKEYPVFKVLLEVLTASETIKNKLKRYYSDIVVADKQGNYIIIELKYKTKKSIYGGVELLDHGATDLGRYDFLWDIRRIEILKENNTEVYKFNNNLKNFVNGYAIMLTNESKYWTISKENNNTLYKNFCISNNDFIEKNVSLFWNKKKVKCFVNNTFRNNDLVFANHYKFNWKQYNNDFKYLIKKYRTNNV